MDLLTAKPGSLFRKYLIASMGSAVVTSIYYFVDGVAIGQYEGPMGAAAVAIAGPVFGILIGTAVMIGLGGSVLMSQCKGAGKERDGNDYFTTSLLLLAAAAIFFYILFFFIHKNVFYLFGATDDLMPLVRRYTDLIMLFSPVFLASVLFGFFIRNDNDPRRAMAAVIIGGSINVLGDWVFVFVLDLGIAGAAWATIVGTSVQIIILCTHFLTKDNQLKLVKPEWRSVPGKFGRILRNGVAASAIDYATIIMTLIINNQIMRYSGETALAVYGAGATVASLFLSLFGGVGQASQPLISANYGAAQKGRVKAFLKLALWTSAVMGIVLGGIVIAIPKQIVALLMKATPEALSMAPEIIRIYGISFIFMGINIFVTYYLQSISRNKESFVISLGRGLVVNGILIFLLPLLWGSTGIWIAIAAAEFIVMLYSLLMVRKARL